MTPKPNLANEKDPWQDRYLTEGCCPNRCGPMVRLSEFIAGCIKCHLEWRSKRIPCVFPAETKNK